MVQNQAGARYFAYIHSHQTVSGVYSASCAMDTASDHSPACNSKVKNVWSCTTSYICICVGQHLKHIYHSF
jgi:hypothetical protein